MYPLTFEIVAEGAISLSCIVTVTTAEEPVPFTTESIASVKVSFFSLNTLSSSAKTYITPDFDPAGIVIASPPAVPADSLA